MNKSIKFSNSMEDLFHIVHQNGLMMLINRDEDKKTFS